MKDARKVEAKGQKEEEESSKTSMQGEREGRLR